MRVCDACMKEPSAYTAWTPDKPNTDLCCRCYKLWNKYEQKALKEAYQKLKAKVRKEEVKHGYFLEKEKADEET